MGIQLVIPAVAGGDTDGPQGATCVEKKKGRKPHPPTLGGRPMVGEVLAVAVDALGNVQSIRRWARTANAVDLGSTAGLAAHLAQVATAAANALVAEVMRRDYVKAAEGEAQLDSPRRKRDGRVARGGRRDQRPGGPGRD